jgi:AcrR family transcriptional regulator
VAPRQYDQRLRAQAAEQTRRRVLDALSTHLRTHPAEPAGLDRIAREAGVSRSTIYLVFGSRAGLFDALGSELLHRGGFQDMVRAVLHSNAREGLRGGVRANVTMYAANRDELRALYSMAQLDAEAVGGAVHRMEAGRAAGMEELARRLADQDLLRHDVTVPDATHHLCLFTSFDAFDLLFTGQGLPIDEVTRQLATAADRAICESP